MALRLFLIFFGLVGILTGALPALAEDQTEELVYDPAVCAAPANSSVSAAQAADSAACLAMMAAFPQPTIERAPLDFFTLNHYSFWRVGPAPVNLYAAPGGALSGQIPAGFNFIRAIDTSVAGWLQRLGGEWLRRADAEYVEASTFSGFLLPAGWTQPFAVILDKTGIYTSLRPGEKGSAASAYVTRRYDLVNIFAQAEDEAGAVWYLIGPRQWLRQEFVTKFAPVASPPPSVSGRWLAIDLFEQTLIAYEGEQPVFATVISSGLPAWSTPEGSYTIWARLERDSMRGATGAPDAYALQQVPWVQYFDGSISLHGTYWHDDFGYRRSHGCVNLTISDARWLYDWTAQSEPDADGTIINTVYIYSSGRYATD